VTDPLDVVVLGQKFHGLDPAEYAGKLRDRLPDHRVQLARTPDSERTLVADAEVVTGSNIEADLVEHVTDLQLFACAYAGYGHLPLDALWDAGVAVTSASGIHGPNAAEQVLGYLLTFARRLDEGWRRKQRNLWQSYPTHELAGSTVCIVGLGAIGQAITTRLDGFEVETVGVRYSPEKGGPTDEVVGYGDVHEAFARSQYVVCCCPLTDQTRGLVDEAALETMPPEAVLVNVARGEVVETDALVSMLRRNHVRGAALDVTDPEPLPEDHPLWTFENVQITPHNAGFTPAYHDRLADLVGENVRRLAAGADDLRNLVGEPGDGTGD
jgi:phosphoglycerate dehydrogenase-like enzyme